MYKIMLKDVMVVVLIALVVAIVVGCVIGNVWALMAGLFILGCLGAVIAYLLLAWLVYEWIQSAKRRAKKKEVER